MNILITGGASGLGKHITETLALRSQDRILFTFCRSTSEANALETRYSNARGIRCDFKDASQISQLLAEIETFDIDALVNNFYTTFVEKHFHKMEPDQFKTSFEENILPTIKMTQQAIRIFQKKKFGKIINILTTALLDKPPIGWSQYTANKAYLRSLSKSWAAENAAFNITSNCILPSFLGIGMTANTDERIKERIRRQHPSGKLLTAEEVAWSVNSLLDDPQKINGAEIVLNGQSEIEIK